MDAAPRHAASVRPQYNVRIVIGGIHDGPFRNRGIVLDVVPGALLRSTVERFATDTILRHPDLYWRGTMEVFKAFVERYDGNHLASLPT
jgi:hypothetical protein